MRCFLFLFLLAAHAGFGQPIPVLSDSARISLITVDPGAETYSMFGHSALRVFDPANRLDRCYNYGTFDFDQPNFLLKFCRGKLLYFLDIESYRGFEYGNLSDRRAMHEQWLNLQPARKQRLFELLTVNARAENRSYKYDFFYDNCATRIRDIVQESYLYEFAYDSSQLSLGTTMRQLLRPYLQPIPGQASELICCWGCPPIAAPDPRISCSCPTACTMCSAIPWSLQASLWSVRSSIYRHSPSNGRFFSQAFSIARSG